MIQRTYVDQSHQSMCHRLLKFQNNNRNTLIFMFTSMFIEWTDSVFNFVFIKRNEQSQHTSKRCFDQ